MIYYPLILLDYDTSLEGAYVWNNNPPQYKILDDFNPTRGIVKFITLDDFSQIWSPPPPHHDKNSIICGFFLVLFTFFSFENS
jgi:hypothetical protein